MDRGTTENNDGDDLVENQEVYVVRLGCTLHILQISVTAGLESKYFMGPMGSGSWHEWEKSHLVALLGTVWYSYAMSRSGSSTANFDQFNNLVMNEFETSWSKKFIRPA